MIDFLLKSKIEQNLTAQIHPHIPHDFLVFGHQFLRLVLRTAVECDHISETYFIGFFFGKGDNGARKIRVYNSLQLSPTLRAHKYDEREERAGEKVLHGGGGVEKTVLLLEYS